MLNKFLPLFGALLLATNAHAVLVDFESDISLTQQTIPAGSPYAGTYTTQVRSQGFAFGVNNSYTQWYLESYGITSTGSSDGNFIQSAVGQTFVMDVWRDDGQLFSVASLDLYGVDPLGTYGNCPACNHIVGPAEIRGYDASGLLINSLSVYAGSASWQTVSFDASWSNLAYIQVWGQEAIGYSGFPVSGTSSLSLDNFNATVVPIPGAVWLFASALGLMGWRSRR